MKISITKDRWIGIIPIAFFILVWKIASLVVGSEIILPSPEVTLYRLLQLIGEKGFWLAVGGTVRRGVLGFLLSLLVGLMVGLVAGCNRTANRLLQPYILICRSTPVMSIILLALIWFRNDQVPMFVCFLVAFPVICGNIIEGIKNVDSHLVEMASLYRVKIWRTVIELYIPSIMPYLLAGLSTAMGIGWKVVIAAEVLAQPRFAVGTKMQIERMYLETTGVFAWTIIALLLSYISEQALRLIEKKMITWR